MIALAIIPSIILFVLIWRSDKTEKEPLSLLAKLFLFGALTIISAMVIGNLGERLVRPLLGESLIFLLIDNFILTALVEESGKYFVLKKTTWKHPAFNYTFDAVVYSVCASLGFATLENILYILDGNLSTAISRGLLSVPGHVSYAIFMGFYYGMAKLASTHGDEKQSKNYLIKALWIPVALHGFYDFCLSTDNLAFIILIIIFEIVIFVLAAKKVRKLSREDRLIEENGIEAADGTGIEMIDESNDVVIDESEDVVIDESEADTTDKTDV